ncbi:MAG: DNA polymerase III subunit epsilon [Rhizobiaceae bacterium]|nr:DNA polymerase III subunit epsilon [Rhizobiaceae bacterium]
MREIVFDTETTGLDAREDRIIEIGGVELENGFPTGRVFHHYIHPGNRAIHAEAQAIHGISMADLEGKPNFAGIAEQFVAFFDNARLVAHNAGFDIGFINAELERLRLPPFDTARVVDTLAIARRKHPMGPNSLDALCRRYGIDNSRRVHHGALLDSELLAEVYIELAGGRQAALGLDNFSASGASANEALGIFALPERPAPLAPRLSEKERAAHTAMVAGLGPAAIWASFPSTHAAE